MTNLSIGAHAPSYLTFHDAKLTIIDRNGQIWVTSSDIARALGYSRSDFVNRVYSRHASEFTDSMTACAELTEPDTCSGTPANGESVRIFSLRGAHLVTMLTRTPRAAEFRRWVLDLLDREASRPAPTTTAAPQPKALPAARIDANVQSRINKHAWSLTQSVYEQMRSQMIADIESKKHAGTVESWRPTTQIESVLHHLGAAAELCNAFGKSLRSEGERLAALAGLDYEAVTQNLRQR